MRTCIELRTTGTSHFSYPRALAPLDWATLHSFVCNTLTMWCYAVVSWCSMWLDLQWFLRCSLRYSPFNNSKLLGLVYMFHAHLVFHNQHSIVLPPTLDWAVNYNPPGVVIEDWYAISCSINQRNFNWTTSFRMAQVKLFICLFCANLFWNCSLIRFPNFTTLLNWGNIMSQLWETTAIPFQALFNTSIALTSEATPAKA